MTEIEKLKEALRFAILNTNRVSRKIIDYDSAGSTYAIDWLERIKEWAKLCDLDLKKHNPFYFYMEKNQSDENNTGTR